MIRTYFLLLTILLSGCIQEGEIDIYQNERDNVINVHKNINEIPIKDIIISGVNRVYSINKYLIIEDYNSIENHIHILNKNNFKVLASTAPLGQGPREIANIGYIATDKKHNNLYVSDHGKQKIFSYNIDSVLTVPSYLPITKAIMSENLFPSEYQYINDTLCIGRIIKPINNRNYEPLLAKWNMSTGKIIPFKYKNKKINKKRITIAVSAENNICIECHSNRDLISIYDLNGELKYNIYGPSWNKETDNIFFHHAIISKDKIIVSAYSQKDINYNAQNRTSTFPSQLIMFDLKGNYIRTLETEYPICDFCYDSNENRIIMSTDSDIQFAYLDIDDI